MFTDTIKLTFNNNSLSFSKILNLPLISYKEWTFYDEEHSVGELTKTISLKDIITSTKLTIRKIKIVQTCDNFCSLKYNNRWIYERYSNLIDSGGAEQCVNKTTILDSKFDVANDHFTFRANDNAPGWFIILTALSVYIQAEVISNQCIQQ